MQDGNDLKLDIRIAYLGPTASFSHQAAAESFKTYSAKSLCPLPSFDAILSNIQKSSSPSASNDDVSDYDFALLPVENSTNGGVVPVLDLLTKCDTEADPSLYPDVQVVGEHYLQVHHCLLMHPLALKDAPQEAIAGPQALSSDRTKAPPLYRAHNVTTLYTHPQVWGQCNNFLSYNFPTPQVERRNMSSTSAAATFVANNSFSSSSTDSTTTDTATNLTSDSSLPTSISEEASGHIAAIASSLAGQQNNLAIVASNIEDEPGKNTTRFFIIRNETRPSLPSKILKSLPWATPSLTELTFYKSLITFTVKHDTPGWLAIALGVFQKHELNLTAITTRPSREAAWHYVFFVECEEKRMPGGDVGRIRDMLEDLKGCTGRSKLLGSWINRLKHT